jgi:hypothetical protein
MHVVVSRQSSGQLAHFRRHLLEMLLVMMLGMFAGAATFVTATGISTEDAIEKHSVAWVSVMAFSMTAPMVAWMRYRHHGWRLLPTARYLLTLVAAVQTTSDRIAGKNA